MHSSGKRCPDSAAWNVTRPAKGVKAVNELLMRLPPDPMTVTTARRLVTEELLRSGLVELSDDAALLVTEVVSNAVMHARTAILLHVTITTDRVRVEVDDGSSQLPAWSPSMAESLSGRGLTLVNALASRWGADLLDVGGKTVWFELTEDRPDPLPYRTAEELLEQWSALDDVPPAPGVEITLGDLPAQGLLHAREHGDNILREYQLLLLNYESHPSGAEISPHLIALARRLAAAADEFAEARRQLRAAALDSLAVGQDTVTVRLRLQATDAGAAERFRDALDQADEHCRTGVMLTPPSSPELSRLRHYYLTDIARQLRTHQPDERTA